MDCSFFVVRKWVLLSCLAAYTKLTLPTFEAFTPEFQRSTISFIYGCYVLHDQIYHWVFRLCHHGVRTPDLKDILHALLHWTTSLLAFSGELHRVSYFSSFFQTKVFFMHSSYHTNGRKLLFVMLFWLLISETAECWKDAADKNL